MIYQIKEPISTEKSKLDETFLETSSWKEAQICLRNLNRYRVTGVAYVRFIGDLALAAE